MAKPIKKTFACPCGGYLTLTERGAYGICKVCFWEDDADVVRCGPNKGVSLAQARMNFTQDGVSDPQFKPHVRPPRPEEFPFKLTQVIQFLHD